MFYRVETPTDLRTCERYWVRNLCYFFSLSASFLGNIFCSDKHRALFFYPATITFTSRLYSSCVWPVWRMGYVNKKNEPAGSCNRYLSHKITPIIFSELRLRAAWSIHIAGNFVWEWSVQSHSDCKAERFKIKCVWERIWTCEIRNVWIM
jgi:hypothetical protein